MTTQGGNRGRPSGPLTDSVELVVLASAATVSIIPFIQSIATKAGEDAYGSIKRLLNKHFRSGENADIKVLKLQDPDRNLYAHLSSELSHDGSAQLFRLDLDDPRIHDGDILFNGGWHFLGQESHLSWHDKEEEWVERPAHDLEKVRAQLLQAVYRRERFYRISVNLTSQAYIALSRLKEDSGLSVTDIINRAISVYGFLDEKTRSGRDIQISDNETGEVQVIRFL
jgi:hypothetical protein